MICKVIETIEKNELLTNVKSVAVGVSGGADSMCLLHILNSVKDKYGFSIKAVHINHNLRGNESDFDEAFVCDFCKENDIELTVFSENISELAAKYGMGEEETGRKVRYDCFAKMNCDAVAVAHSLSDSIETIIFNLARGTGLKGLCGISAKREPNIIRPLIECSRDEIESYCKYNNIKFVTDSTNLTDDYKRNLIRHRIVPVLADLNSEYLSSISRTAAILREEFDFIERCACDLLIRAKHENHYDAKEFRNADPVIRKRCFHILLKEHMNKDVESKHIELCEEAFLRGTGKLEFSKDAYILFSDDIISFNNREMPFDSWQADIKNFKANTPVGEFRIVPCDSFDKDAFDASLINKPLVISSRREGDRITLKDRGVSKTLKKLFNEMKIPCADRNKVAVLRNGENIVWVDGVGINAKYLPDKNSESVFRIIKEV